MSPVVEGALVDATVALGLGVPPGAEGAVESIAAHLAPLGRTLLVLDGCEGVIDAVASLAQSLVADCPQLTVVVTTRTPMELDDERVVRVQPLPPRALGPDGAPDPTLQLLRDRVRSGGGELDLDPADDDAMALLDELCERCSGLPLVIELAAAQLTAMPVGDLLDTLPAQGSWRDPLRAFARSSVAMLDPDEVVVFRRFAVLDGPVGLPMVRAVVAEGSLAPERVIRILRELAARGLVTVDRSGPRWRYQQDDDLHRLARELLVEAGEESAALARLGEAVEAMLPDDPRSPPAPYTSAVSGVIGSVRGVFAAALDGRVDRAMALRLAFRLHRYWAATNVAEGRFWLARLLVDAPAGRESALATYALGYLGYWAGDTDEAVRCLQAAVDGLRGVEDAYAARALIYLAGLADDQDRGEAAVEHVREAVAAAAPFDTDLQVAAAIGMGCVLAERADPAAVGAAGAAMELCRERGSVEQLTAALPTAAMVCWQVGDLASARRYVDEAWPLHRETRRIARVVLLSAAAGVALADEDVAAATDFATRGDDEATELGVEREVPLVRCLRARALLAGGDVRLAAVHARAAVEAARDLAYRLAPRPVPGDGRRGPARPGRRQPVRATRSVRPRPVARYCRSHPRGRPAAGATNASAGGRRGDPVAGRPAASSAAASPRCRGRLRRSPSTWSGSSPEGTEDLGAELAFLAGVRRGIGRLDGEERVRAGVGDRGVRRVGRQLHRAGVGPRMSDHRRHGSAGHGLEPHGLVADRQRVAVRAAIAGLVVVVLVRRVVQVDRHRECALVPGALERVHRDRRRR